jgi:hypothetical protein
MELDQIAEGFVRLALKLNLYDEGFVDAYFGPKGLKPAPDPAGASSEKYNQLLSECRGLLEALVKMKKESRTRHLESLLVAAHARLEQKLGKEFSFDEESALLYETVAPQHTETELQDRKKKLESFVPGSGDLTERFNRYREQFIVSRNVLPKVFEAAMAEARKRTLEAMHLPKQERFECEYVENAKAGWSAYNWYLGDAKSTIQVNTIVPIYIEQMIHWASHEGYPGHHVQGILRDFELYQKRGWIEFSIAPLYCPSGILSEGGADFGVEVAFPGNDKLTFEKEVLYPIAGLDAANASEYEKIMKLRKDLSQIASIEAARGYVDGRLTRDETKRWYVEYALEHPDRAENRMRFIDNYRSYIINYSVGETLVRNFVDQKAKSSSEKWSVLADLFATPCTPQMIQR